MGDLTLREIIGLISILIGVYFYVFGTLGLVRFPDVYMRIHSAGKVSVLGIFGFIIGGAILLPEMTLKVIVLGIFMFITQPVASHALAQAAYRSGVKLYKPIRDDLQGKIDVTVINPESLSDEEDDEKPAQEPSS